MSTNAWNDRPKTPEQQALVRAAGQVERLQAANERQAVTIDRMVRYLEHRGLVADFNSWVGVGYRRPVVNVDLPDEAAQAGPHKPQ